VSERDAQLASEALAGSGEACEALYAAHAARVAGYFLRSGFSRADADDLLQDTFARAFGSLHAFDATRGTFFAWLAAIARNVARRRWQRRDRQVAAGLDAELADEMLVEGGNPSAGAAQAEELAALRACLAALPDELARLVRLRYVEALTTRAIAAAEGTPEATVRLRLGEARDRLRRCLAGKGVLE